MPSVVRNLSSLAVRFLVGGFLVLPAFAQLTSTPSSESYANTYIGLGTASKSVSIKNTGTSSVTITALTPSCPEFKLSSGTTPTTLAAGKTTSYSFYFAPDSAKLFSCNYTLSVSSGSPLVIPVSGTGLSTTGKITSSPTSLSFANQKIGTPSAAKTITVSNTGTATLQLTGITITPPTFALKPVTLPISIAGGAKTTISVTYSPTLITSETGVVGLVFNDVPEQVVDLTGNGIAATALTITNVATLPVATQSSAYQAQIAATAGTSPYTFTVKTGSTLPTGLALSSAGLISGTLDPSVAKGTYTFSVQATDSAKPTKHTTSKLFSLTVSATTGSACNNISFDVPGTGNPIVALTDLGTGSYQSEEGGLYPAGSNVRPTNHDADGVAFADAVQPLDSSGNPSPTGKYVLLALGESTALDEMGQFLPLARAEPSKNPALVFVDGAQGGATPGQLLTTTSSYFNTIVNNYLPDQGVTAKQVVAVWIEDSNGIATGSFPSDMTTLQTDYETVMNNVHTLFPNATLAYFSSRIYAGYSNGVATINPEPYAYESGFAVKNAINDQLNGNANLNYNPSLGAVKAPWMSWGPYYWANGLLASENGMVWTCQDLQADGTHPASPSGDLKVASQLLNFLKTDDTTAPWFVNP